MKEYTHILAEIASSDAWYGDRKELVGKRIRPFDIVEKGGGWCWCDAFIEGKHLTKERPYAFYRVKIRRLK